MAGTFTLEVINQVNPGTPDNYTVDVVPGETLYQSMCRLQADPTSGFTFVAVESSFGHFVTKINGLEQDTAKNYYWLIFINDLEHPADVGVDGLYPKDGETYIWAYTNTTADHANKIKK